MNKGERKNVTTNQSCLIEQCLERCRGNQQSDAQSIFLEISTVGAGSLNQAIKAIAIARGFLTPSGIEIYVMPSFKEITIDGKEKTAIKLRIEKK